MSAPATVRQDKATLRKGGFAGPARPTDQTGSVTKDGLAGFAHLLILVGG